MTYELWQSQDENVASQAFVAVDQNYLKHPEISDGQHQLIWSVDADSYNDAMTRYHEFMDWEPYKPMVD